MRLLLSFVLGMACVMPISCEERPLFEVPQPIGKRNENSFPLKIIGHYVDPNDASLLSISKTCIVLQYRDWETMAISSLDSAARNTYHWDTTVDETFQGRTVKSKVYRKGDSIYRYAYYLDTIVDLKRGDVLRKLKGHYLLNERLSDNEWKVSKLHFQKGALLLGEVSTSEDLQRLRDITQTISDTVMIFKPTRRELKKFIKDQGFSEERVFFKTAAAEP